MTEPTSPTPSTDDLDDPAGAPAAALGPEELEEIDNILDDLRSRGEEIPQWEFCDGFMTALICSRRPIAPAEYLPMLLGDGAELDIAEGDPLPQLPAFADAAQQARFSELWSRRWAEIVTQLDTDVKKLDTFRYFQPDTTNRHAAEAC